MLNSLTYQIYAESQLHQPLQECKHRLLYKSRRQTQFEEYLWKTWLLGCKTTFHLYIKILSVFTIIFNLCLTTQNIVFKTEQAASQFYFKKILTPVSTKFLVISIFSNSPCCREIWKMWHAQNDIILALFSWQ